MKGVRTAASRLLPKLSRVMVIIMTGLFFVVTAPTTAVHAYNLQFDPSVGSVSNPLQTYTNLGDNDPISIVLLIVNTALIFLGAITLILFIVAGFMWLTAAGAEEKITKAKDIMKGAVIGLVIIMGSYGIAQFVFYAISRATTV